MVPRFITELEDRYNEMFPSNPATLFYVSYPTEEKERFEALLKKAIETEKPLSEKDLIAFFGERNYEEFRAYLLGWYDKEALEWK